MGSKTLVGVSAGWVGSGSTTAGVTATEVEAGAPPDKPSVGVQPAIAKIKVNAMLMKILRKERIRAVMAQAIASQPAKYSESVSRADSAHIPTSKAKSKSQE